MDDPVARLKLSMGPIRSPYSLYIPAPCPSIDASQEKTKYSYNAFQMTSQKSI